MIARVSWGVLAVLVVGAGVSLSHGARAIQGAVGEVAAIDAGNLGPVGFRIWSALPGGETNLNENTVSCRNVRCIRNYLTSTVLAGGYVSNQEATQVYNDDTPDQPFYELVDAVMHEGAVNHIGFFGVAGVTANNSGVGGHVNDDCQGPTALNCFGRIDQSHAGPILNNTRAAYGAGASQIRPIGGLNPIPNVNVSTGCCASDQEGRGGNFTVRTFWVDPPTYLVNMRGSTTAPAPPPPVLGVRLYRTFTADCFDPTDADPGWTAIGTFPLGQNSYLDTDAVIGSLLGCYWYALKVRLTGPGGSPNEIETVLGVHSQGAGSTVTPVRIARITVEYAGHGIMNVAWQSGLEGGLRGYYIARSMSGSGPFARVSGFVRVQGDGHEYAFRDRPPAVSRTYFYRIEMVDFEGEVSTSPATAATVPERPRRTRPSVR